MSETNKGFQPSPEEMNQAEEAMTPEQKEMAERKEDVLEQLNDLLTEIHDDRMRVDGIQPIDEQCQERFGLTWDETRQRVFDDLDSMSLWSNLYRLGRVKPQSCNWMTNKLEQVWSLKRIVERSKMDVPENHHGFGGEFDINRRLEQLTQPSEEQPSAQDLLYIAPIADPEKVKDVLASHGINVDELEPFDRL